MEIKDRLLVYIKQKGIRPAEFERNAGLSNAYIQNVKNSIGADKLKGIISYYKDLNPEWLLTGEGEMLKSPSSATEEETPRPPEGIPLIPLSAMAGAFTEDVSVMGYDCERYVIPAFRDADFLIQVKGDSMRPTYLSGDLVACRRVPFDRLFFQWNKTYVLDTDQGPLIKRIRPASSDDRVLIVSDNPEWSPFELPLAHIRAVCLVCGLIRTE